MVKYCEEQRSFILETQNSTYIFGLNDKNVPIHMYYGSKLSDPCEVALKYTDDSRRISRVDSSVPYPQEYVTYCRCVYDEESLKVRYSDGVSDVELTYKSHEIDGDKLTVILEDISYSLLVKLIYLVRPELDMIERSAVIINNGNTAIIENAASANIYLPPQKEYEVFSYAGAWCREYVPVKSVIPEGKLVFDTRRGVSAGPHHVPFFAVSDAHCPATERQGALYYGMLKHAGNFKIVFEKSSAQIVKVTTGINFFDTTVTLNNGESFETPVAIFGYTENGYSGMRERIYDLEFDVLAAKDNITKPFPIIYNSWYPYLFNVTEEKLLALIPKVKHVGAELLVIDDGWMIGRKNDLGGLGDWYADPEAFPNGIAEISRKAHENGLLFGIWVEPEMLTEDSVLYREHPDWVLGYDTREKSYTRHQRVLNLAREDVYQFCEQTMDRIIEEFELDYLKWDMNRYIGERDTTPDFFISFARNMTRLYKHIREKYPKLLIENCAHGGARADFGLFEYCDRINRSDNADPIDVLKIHNGFVDLFHPRYAGGAGNVAPPNYHLTGRTGPLKYRTMLGMTGSMSIGVDLLTAPAEDIEFIKEQVEYYKTIRPILHNSYVYKLSMPTDDKTFAWQYLARDRRNAVVFVFSHGIKFPDGLRVVYPMGLIPDKKYEVNGKTYSGDTLMKFGITFEKDRIKGDYYSKIIEIKEV